MATRPILNFAVVFLGDGSDITFTVNMARGPVHFQTVGGFALSPVFNEKPAEVQITGSTLAVASSNYDANHGELTVTLSDVPAADTQYTLTGFAKY